MRQTIVALIAWITACCCNPTLISASILVDQDENCREWAEQGECEANPDYMWENCQKSCADVKAEEDTSTANQHSFFELDALDIDEKLFNFSQLKGKTTLIVNVASYCGYTESHYRGLVELYESLKDSGKFEILAFPCNQFGAQEPKTCPEIKRFAHQKGVRFHMMNKIDVNGPNTHKVYNFLKEATGVKRISWNFATYFVVSPSGEIEAFSGTEPHELRDTIVDLMNEEL